MKSHARVAIVGDVVMEVGLLYRLAPEQWSDVAPLEKGERRKAVILGDATRDAANPRLRG